MSMFYIWTPHRRASHTLEFVLTRGDSYGIAEGTKEFFAQVLQDLGLKVGVEDGSVNPCRSKYYTDYLGEEDWRDNWQLVWRAQVTTTKPLAKLPQATAPWIETDATDESWDVAPDDAKAVVCCLVVSDFDNDAALERAQAKIDEDKKVKAFQRQYDVAEPTFERADVLNKFPQLQVNLGQFAGEFFAQGADYAEHVMKLCQQAKGTVHFSERT